MLYRILRVPAEPVPDPIAPSVVAALTHQKANLREKGIETETQFRHVGPACQQAGEGSEAADLIPYRVPECDTINRAAIRRAVSAKC